MYPDMQPVNSDERDAFFEQLFAQYQEPILNYLYRMVGNRQRAEELAQDAFVKAYRALDRLPDDANHRAWLYRIATNCAYDYLRRRRLIKWLPLLDNDRPDGAERTPEGLVADRDAVQAALEQLTPEYRVPLILYSVEGYSTEQIATMLDLSRSAVKTRLFRARKRFRDAYGGDL
jgi:RNA polymerase sigma-70 factor (ECF subfamily)